MNNINWTAVGSITGFLGVIVAIISLRSQIRLSRLSQQADMVLRFNDKMDNDPVRKWRMIASKKLLANEIENHELECLLDFWATIAFLIRSGVFDRRFAYDQFAWWIVRYWLRSKDHVAKSRDTDPGSFRNLEQVAHMFIQMEKKDCYSEQDYSDAKLEAFLKEESCL